MLPAALPTAAPTITLLPFPDNSSPRLEDGGGACNVLIEVDPLTRRRVLRVEARRLRRLLADRPVPVPVPFERADELVPKAA